ncbi:hypothetical protein [Lacrimispora celerecrescens]|uniref:hypothetical protein n=1 Tax=Lacrimispora celerecrescens TaxID=29354 RepID=UPI000B1683B1|nr:hypothetical protein [Lacrimispora celerecrescens]
MPKKRGQERGNTLRVYLYAQKTWAGKEETPYGYTFMPKKHGQERGKETLYGKSI